MTQLPGLQGSASPQGLPSPSARRRAEQLWGLTAEPAAFISNHPTRIFYFNERSGLFLILLWAFFLPKRLHFFVLGLFSHIGYQLEPWEGEKPFQSLLPTSRC